RPGSAPPTSPTGRGHAAASTARRRRSRSAPDRPPRRSAGGGSGPPPPPRRAPPASAAPPPPGSTAGAAPARSPRGKAPRSPSGRSWRPRLAIPLGELYQTLVGGDAVARLGADRLHHPVALGADDVLHLHGLEDGDDLAGLDLLAGRHVDRDDQTR